MSGESFMEEDLGSFHREETESLLQTRSIEMLSKCDVGCSQEGTWRLNFHQNPRQTSIPISGSPRNSLQGCLKRSFTDVELFYQQQKQMLEGFSEMDNLADSGSLSECMGRKDSRVGEFYAIQISNLANLFLFAAKVYASIRSKSLAIIASTLDSLLDLLSGLILWFADFSMQRPNPYLYPIGKKRMQPLGILVFSSVMATLGLQILLESVRILISKDHDLALEGEKGKWVIGIMVSVTIVKFLLMIYCRTFKNEIVLAYAQDHFFDVITNMIGLLAAVLANEFAWWIDPAGAIVLAIYTIRTWSKTVLENVNSLVGKTASPDYLQKITFLCWNHHKDILQIDTVRAYTFGSHYFAEVDIVLPREMPLEKAHDIGESLQNKLESLPDIERAFVHLDYEVSHRPEHAPKQ